MTDRNAAARLVLGTGTAFGLVIFAFYLTSRPGWFGLNYRVYHAAAEAALSGGDLYAVTPPDTDFRYLYPPVAVVPFLLPTLLSGALPLADVPAWLPGYLAITAASVTASIAATVVLIRYLESIGYDLPTSERVLVGGFLLLSSHAAPSLVYGQVNHLLVAAIVLGLVWLARDAERRAGVAFGAAAFVKVFPAAIGLWLLRRLAWRAIAAAVGTAAALTLAGLAAFGVDTYRAYVVEALLPRRDAAAFVGGLDPAASYVTLRRPLSVAFPAADPAWYAVGAALLLAPVLALLYWRPASRTDRHVAIHGTLAAMLLFFPSLLVYTAFLAFPLVVLLYDLPAGWGRRLFVAGAVLTNLSFSHRGLREVLGASPLDPDAAAAVSDALLPVLQLGTPVLYGCLLTLAGCVIYRVEAGTLTLDDVLAPVRE